MLKLHTETAGVGCLLLEFCLKAFRAICRSFIHHLAASKRADSGFNVYSPPKAAQTFTGEGGPCL
jgi:hypothetical protein